MSIKKNRKMCLCMIVKNESHIIEETLECMKKYIDYWVICDTGSTDNTKNIIKNYFKKNNIDGELYQHGWKNFGHNRTLAFQCAYKKSNYVWVIDADDIISGDFKLPKKLNHDAYYLKYGSHDFTYQRLQIFNNQLKWEYKGVLHEYPHCNTNRNLSMCRLDGNYYIDSRRLGNRNLDTQKYIKDANVLVDAINNNVDVDLHDRYLFYAAQSYRDAGSEYYEKSIEYYKKRVDVGGWKEEVFYSCFQIGQLMEKLKYPFDEIIQIYLRGYKAYPTRCESLNAIAKLYYNIGDHELAYNYFSIANKIPLSTSSLFVSSYMYLYENKYYLCILCNLLKKFKESTNYYDELKNNTYIPKYMLCELDVINEKNKTNQTNCELNDNVFEEYIFYINNDSYGEDIAYYPDKSIIELKQICDSLDESVGFNTYGYIKKKVNTNLIKLPDKKYFHDGIYIKKSVQSQ